MNSSLASSLASLPPQDRQAVLASLTESRRPNSFGIGASGLGPTKSPRMTASRRQQMGTWLASPAVASARPRLGSVDTERVKGGSRSIALVAETQKDLEEVMVARINRDPPSEGSAERPLQACPVGLAEWRGGAGLQRDRAGPAPWARVRYRWVDELARSNRYARETWDMLPGHDAPREDPRVS